MLQSIIAKGSSSAKAAWAGEQILVRQNLHFYFKHNGIAYQQKGFIAEAIVMAFAKMWEVILG